MCTGGCAKCLGGTLIPLAVFGLLANILLFFPGGKVVEDNGHLSEEVWYFGGILGSGVLMIFPALVFLGLKNNDCCGCCGNESCGKRFASACKTRRCGSSILRLCSAALTYRPLPASIRLCCGFHVLNPYNYSLRLKHTPQIVPKSPFLSLTNLQMPLIHATQLDQSCYYTTTFQMFFQTITATAGEEDGLVGESTRHMHTRTSKLQNASSISMCCCNFENAGNEGKRSETEPPDFQEGQDEKRRDYTSSLQGLLYSNRTLTTSIQEKCRRQVKKYKGSGQSRIKYETACRTDPGTPNHPLSCLMRRFEDECDAASNEKAEERVKRPDTEVKLSSKFQGKILKMFALVDYKKASAGKVPMLNSSPTPGDSLPTFPTLQIS
ncbi:hypothetical protein A6R68_06947, partial [Neotoma lepida]